MAGSLLSEQNKLCGTFMNSFILNPTLPVVRPEAGSPLTTVTVARLHRLVAPPAERPLKFRSLFLGVLLVF